MNELKEIKIRRKRFLYSGFFFCTFHIIILFITIEKKTRKCIFPFIRKYQNETINF